ncbi:LAETG motif-containing sortase-dependent surface protein [Streptomyces sp. NPDC003006]
MKLRRAMAAAAATAAIVPMALLSAPAAFATEGAAPAPAAPTAAPTPTDSPADSASETSKPKPKSTPDPKFTPGRTPAIPKPSADKPTKPTKPEETEGSDGASAEDEDGKKPADCAVDDSGVDRDSVLEIELSGLPGKITPGSGWHQFELTATNPTDEALGEVRWIAAVDSDSKGDDDKNRLSNFANLQYLDPETETWESINDDETGGLAFDVIDLGAEETADIKLRLNIGAKAPLGKGYATGVGEYVDSELDCTHTSFMEHPLTIGKPGNQGEHPGTPKPKPTLTATAKPTATPTATPTAAPAPQGTADDLPTDSLAETGSSSALPAIGLVGGAAVVVGAGAVFVVRRRKADSAA